MFNSSEWARSRQTLVRQLLNFSKKETFRRPEPHEHYYCPFKNDYTHWAGTAGRQMIFVATATSKWTFNFLTSKIGICRECFTEAQEGVRP